MTKKKTITFDECRTCVYRITHKNKDCIYAKGKWEGGIWNCTNYFDVTDRKVDISKNKKIAPIFKMKDYWAHKYVKDQSDENTTYFDKVVKYLENNTDFYPLATLGIKPKGMSDELFKTINESNNFDDAVEYFLGPIDKCGLPKLKTADGVKWAEPQSNKSLNDINAKVFRSGITENEEHDMVHRIEYSKNMEFVLAKIQKARNDGRKHISFDEPLTLFDISILIETYNCGVKIESYNNYSWYLIEV